MNVQISVCAGWWWVCMCMCMCMCAISKEKRKKHSNISTPRIKFYMVCYRVLWYLHSIYCVYVVDNDAGIQSLCLLCKIRSLFRLGAKYKKKRLILNSFFSFSPSCHFLCCLPSNSLQLPLFSLCTATQVFWSLSVSFWFLSVLATMCIKMYISKNRTK